MFLVTDDHCLTVVIRNVSLSVFESSSQDLKTIGDKFDSCPQKHGLHHLYINSAS